jgi:hypothetical protein
MQKIIEIEGRFVTLESKWIEINGNQVEAVGTIYLVKPESGFEQMLTSTVTASEVENVSYISGGFRGVQQSEALMAREKNG